MICFRMAKTTHYLEDYLEDIMLGQTGGKEWYSLVLLSRRPSFILGRDEVIIHSIPEMDEYGFVTGGAWFTPWLP